MNYLASPPLVVAWPPLAGTMDLDLTTEPIGTGSTGREVYLRDLWPTPAEIESIVDTAVAAEMFTRDYADVFSGDERWQDLDVPPGETFSWDLESTYVRHPPYFEGMQTEPSPVTDIHGARVLAVLGDSVTTDHISPAGAIKTDSPAGQYLTEHGVQRSDFNSYGSRRGNHEVMIRGTFANIRLRNQLAPGTEGGVTLKLPGGEEMWTPTTRPASTSPRACPSSCSVARSTAPARRATGRPRAPALLGVLRRAGVESFERIHRSNLIGMGVLPLQFKPGRAPSRCSQPATRLFDVTGIEAMNRARTPREVTARGRQGVPGNCPIDTPGEAEYYRHGGIMQYVLRSLLDKP